MRLFAVGLSHRTAPVELREAVDFARGGVDTALSALVSRGVGREVVVLSTCNRAEIYAAGDSDATADGIGRFFSDYHNVAHAHVAEHLYVRRGTEAARHLFRVAAGLDSLVVGEPQILGQVKAAYAVGERRPLHRRADEPAVPFGVRDRQTRARRNRRSAKARSRSAMPRSRWRKRSSGT